MPHVYVVNVSDGIIGIYIFINNTSGLTLAQCPPPEQQQEVISNNEDLSIMRATVMFVIWSYFCTCIHLMRISADIFMVYEGATILFRPW